jgi:hypothetical protein
MFGMGWGDSGSRSLKRYLNQGCKATRFLNIFTFVQLDIIRKQRIITLTGKKVCQRIFFFTVLMGMAGLK